MESGTEIFRRGSLVEVSIDKNCFKNSWYVAKILELLPQLPSGNSRALVEYQDLFNDKDESEPLIEVVDTLFIRPLPPSETNVSFELYDVVDTFYRDGWLTGVIICIKDSRYTVFFPSNNEIQVDGSDMRLHKMWVDGTWVRPGMERTTGLLFSAGAAVEVSFDKQDSRDAWFPAIVLLEVGLGSFKVQCQSSKNGSEAGVLEVIVDNLHIRPSPPRLEGKKFGLLDKVDAFFDFGWWSGVITKVLAGRRYVVFFKHTNVEKEFIHPDLRPHMEWTDGKWVGASQEVLGTTYSEEKLGHVLNSSNTSVDIQLESLGTAIDDAGDKTSHSKNSEKDQLAQPTPCLENSTSLVMSSNKKNVKEATTQESDTTPSWPSKKLKEGNTPVALITHAAGQSNLAPIDALTQELSCGFATPTTGGAGSNLSEQPTAGNQSSMKIGGTSQGKKVGNEQKSNSSDSQKTNSVRRKGRPRRSQITIAQPVAEGKEVNAVGRAEGTAGEEGAINIVGKDVVMGTNEMHMDLQAQNPSELPKEESLKVMRDQKRNLNNTTEGKQEDGKNGIVSTRSKRRGRPPKILKDVALEALSEGRMSRVLFKRSPKASSAGRGPNLPVKRSPRTVKRSPRTSVREPRLKRQRDSSIGAKLKGPKITSEGSNLNSQIDSGAGLDLNFPDASFAGRAQNAVVVVFADEKDIKDCTMNENELPSGTLVESTVKRGLQDENPVQPSRRPYRKRTADGNLPARYQSAGSSKTRTPRARKQKISNETVGQVLSRQVVKNSSKRGRRKSININAGPPVQGSQVALGEKTAQFVETGSMTKQVEIAVGPVHSMSDDQPLSMWFEVHNSPMADNSRLVNQWNEARERQNEAVMEPPRIDATGETVPEPNQSLPFVKSSPVWNVIESMEAFQMMPQKPHFRCLENCREELREGMAIGNMVNFACLLDKVTKLKFDDPRNNFHSSLEALRELEAHGFDIEPLRKRINELLAIKDRQEQLKGRAKEVEAQIVEHTHEKTRIDEEMYEIDKMIIELQEKRALALSTKESKDSEISTLLSSVDGMKERIGLARQDFEKLSSSPL